MSGQSAALGKAAATGDATSLTLSRFAEGRWRAIYGDLDNAGLAAALRGWRAWRQEQIALHPDHAEKIDLCYLDYTAWPRQELQRRLAPKPTGQTMTTADLAARYGDRLRLRAMALEGVRDAQIRAWLDRVRTRLGRDGQ